jgi:hypothetical protein
VTRHAVPLLRKLRVVLGFRESGAGRQSQFWKLK